LLRNRNRFKDSYGPPGRSETSPSSRRKVFRDQGDPIAAEERIEWELRLQESTAEAQQLRSALRVSSNALAEAAACLPPEHRRDVRADEALHADLLSHIKVKDDELMRLRKIELNQHNVGARYKRSILVAVSQWAPRAEAVLTRETFEAWHELQREATSRKITQAALSKMQSGIMISLKTWEGMQFDSLAKAVLSEWLRTVRTSKLDEQVAKLKDAKYREKIVLATRAMDKENNWVSKAMCWASWRALSDQQRATKRLQEQRAELNKATKELRFEAMRKAVLLLSGPNAKVAIHAWGQFALSQKERRRNKGKVMHRLANMIFQMDQVMLKVFQDAWRAQLDKARRVRGFIGRIFLDDKRSILQACLEAWKMAQAAGRREKELAQHDVQLQAVRDQTKRAMDHCGIAMALAVARASDPFLLQIVLPAWVEVFKEGKRERIEREELEKAWEAREKEKVRLDARRASVLEMATRSDARILLNLVWSVWSDSVGERRERSEFEADLKRQADEAVALQAEAAEARLARQAALAAEDVRHAEDRQRDEQRRRKAVFLMSMENAKAKDDDRMLFRVVLDAWRDISKEARAGIEVRQLQEKLRESEKQRGNLELLVSKMQMAKPVPPLSAFGGSCGLGSPGDAATEPPSTLMSSPEMPSPMQSSLQAPVPEQAPKPWGTVVSRRGAPSESLASTAASLPSAATAPSEAPPPSARGMPLPPEDTGCGVAGLLSEEDAPPAPAEAPKFDHGPRDTCGGVAGFVPSEDLPPEAAPQEQQKQPSPPQQQQQQQQKQQQHPSISQRMWNLLPSCCRGKRGTQGPNPRAGQAPGSRDAAPVTTAEAEAAAKLPAGPTVGSFVPASSPSQSPVAHAPPPETPPARAPKGSPVSARVQPEESP